MADNFGCEPLRVWCRAEPRAREVELDRAIRSEIADPQWMLGRQWQFGEFKGEDSGSAVLAKVAARSTRLTALGPPGAAPESYSDGVPLEVRVEREAPHHDLRARIRAGRKLLALLDREGAAHDASGGAPPYVPSYYRGLLRELYPFVVASGAPSGTGEIVARARLETNPDAHQLLSAVSGRALDGLALFDVLPDGPLDWAALPGDLAVGVVAGHAAFVLRALDEFRTWCRARWGAPPEAACWDPSALEYRFVCHLEHPDGGDLALVASEYASGRLDWYSFDLGAHALSEPNEEAYTTRVASVIPTPAEFPGMPHARWWQLEDGSVDLGHIRADTTDIAKTIVAEFALLFGNNWFVQPWSQEYGTLGVVEGIIVTDVFGQRTLVRPAVQSEPSWVRWDFFSLSSPFGQDAALGQHLFLPPAVGLVDEDRPIESVAFLRDEMANTVWAVERAIPDLVGSGRNGNDAARAVQDRLRRQEPPAPEPPPGLRYVLGGSVPENWIPFIPVHEERDDRAIRLQRASMPRFFMGGITPIRPVTRLLRPGLEGETQHLPYFVNEEEAPRAGVVIEASHQRTRWHDGTTFVWLGRRKRQASGEGGSGLQFDVIRETRAR